MLSLVVVALLGATPAQAPDATSAQSAVQPGSLYRRYLGLRALPAESADQAEHLIVQARALLQEDPDFAPAYMLLGKGLYYRGRRRNNDPGSFTEARQAFASALKLDPQLLAATHELAILTHRQGRPAEARQAYYDSFGGFLTGMAYLNWRLGRLAEAHRWIKLAADRDRNDVSWQDYRARIVASLGDYGEAIKTYAELVQSPGGRLAHRVALSQLHLAAGNTDQARAVAVEHFALVDGGRGIGTDFEDAAGLALLHGEDGRALRWARRSVEDRPDAVFGRLYLAHLIKRSDPRAAAAHVAHARNVALAGISGGGVDWRNWVELAAAQASSGESSPALATLSDAVGRGWRDRAMLELDPLFRPLRQWPEFRRIIEDIRERVAAERRALAYPSG